jgi:hypothetical protein
MHTVSLYCRCEEGYHEEDKVEGVARSLVFLMVALRTGSARIGNPTVLRFALLSKPFYEHISREMSLCGGGLRGSLAQFSQRVVSTELNPQIRSSWLTK